MGSGGSGGARVFVLFFRVIGAAFRPLIQILPQPFTPRSQSFGLRRGTLALRTLLREGAGEDAARIIASGIDKAII